MGQSPPRVDMRERRAIVRQKSLLQARIYLNHRRSSIDCVLRDATKTGGRLKLHESTALPKLFEIYVPSKDRYLQARAVWHRGHYVGVSWEEEEELDPTAAVPNRSVELLRGRIVKLEHDVATLRRRLNLLQA
jgi:hypothetical protein